MKLWLADSLYPDLAVESKRFDQASVVNTHSKDREANVSFDSEANLP